MIDIGKKLQGYLFTIKGANLTSPFGKHRTLGKNSKRSGFPSQISDLQDIMNME